MAHDADFNSGPIWDGMGEQASTGVPGLDQVLPGGLPRDRVYLVEGHPGTGKTTLALQFLLAGATRQEAGLYVTLSESRRELEAVARSHGWSLQGLEIFELAPAEAELNREDQYTFFHPEEVELERTVQTILEKVERVQPKRLVLDSLAELRLLAREPTHYRKQALAFKQYFDGKDCTVLLLDDRTSEATEKQLHSIVHGVIVLDRMSRSYGKNRRHLEIVKLRGAVFTEGYHDYQIRTGGLVVFPRLIAASHQSEFSRDHVSSSIPELDQLLGGGLDRGSSTLLIGPAGCGKSTLAAKYALAAVQRHEGVVMYTFDEGIPSLLVRCRGLGMPLEEHIENGDIVLEQVDPAELAPGEFATSVCDSVVHRHARMVIIDSLNGYLNAMPEERFLTLQMHELLTFLNQQGVVTLLILAQHGMLGNMQSPVDLSYLADTIMLLRFFEAYGEVRRAVSVMKRRSSGHERTIRELEIGGGTGVRVGEALRNFRGVLTGVPEYAAAAPVQAESANDDNR
jgi:circadian clock protein KaiC